MIMAESPESPVPGAGRVGATEEEASAAPGVEKVLDFLRRSGLKEVELALKEDIIEKNELGCVDFEKFLFELPPVRIPPAAFQQSEAGEEDFSAGGRVPRDGSNSGFSSDDDFVSLGSSTSALCSSEFTNPYGLRSGSQRDSDTSSDRMSQFGTARDYPDFDMQNDLFWYDGRGDGRGEGSFNDPRLEYFVGVSEDKFVMTSGAERQLEEDTVGLYDKSEGFETEASVDFLDKPCLFDATLTAKKDANKARSTDEQDGCLGLLCKCCGGARGGRVYEKEPVDYLYLGSKETDGLNWLEPKAGDFVNEIREGDCGNEGIKDREGDFDQLVPFGVDYDELGRDEVSEAQNESHHEVLPSNEKEDAIDDELILYENDVEECEVFELRIIHRKNRDLKTSFGILNYMLFCFVLFCFSVMVIRTGFEENKDLPIVNNTVIGGRYYITEYLGSAAFSKVVQAQDLHTGVDVCLKIIKNDKDFFDQSLDEIKLLKLVNKNDPNDEKHILRLYDYFYHQEHLFIVCELLRANLYEFQKFNQESGAEPYFTLSRLQMIIRQCLEALEYLHRLGIIHCDLKPENILIKSYSRCEIKVIDLGSSCFKTDTLCSYVQSRSYRAPEVMLGHPYNEKIDIWSLGCILAELCSGEVLFPNDSVVMILARMVGVLGPFDIEMLENGQETDKYFTKEHDLYHINEETDQMEYIIPEETTLEHRVGTSDEVFLDFLRSLLEINPWRRPTAREALQHPWLSHSYHHSHHSST
ncbi:unnamed protein product [Linum tenue]|uniref:Protein kinase domain-containing protein n=1 Tax=Linum tenue TaxID=586396 RepID=A0AAV0K0Y3_9ROSI|nr:unnamed protein product [Linum tenue]